MSYFIALYKVTLVIFFGFLAWSCLYWLWRPWRGETLAGMIMCAGMALAGWIMGAAIWG